MFRSTNKPINQIVGVSLLCALNIVLSQFSIQLTPIIKLSISSITIAVSCSLFELKYNLIAAIFLDTINYLLHPTGPYMPLFMLNGFAIVLIYHYFFYQKKASWLRCLYARLLVSVVVDGCMTTLWLYILYQVPLSTLFSTRIPVQLALFPIHFLLLKLVLTALNRQQNLNQIG